MSCVSINNEDIPTVTAAFESIGMNSLSPPEEIEAPGSVDEEKRKSMEEMKGKDHKEINRQTRQRLSHDRQTG